MTILYRLSRIGDALPASHLYPLGHDKWHRRNGAQCFQHLDQVVVELQMGGMVPGADRLLLIRPADGLPHDESGWTIIDQDTIEEVRTLPLPRDPNDLLRLYEDDDEMWSAASPVQVVWVETV